MRKPYSVIIGVVLVVAAAWLLLRPHHDAPTPEPIAVSVGENPPAAPPAPPAESTQTDTKPAEASAPETATSEVPAEPEGPKLAELPTREVKDRPTHTVPEDQPIAAPRPLTFKNGAPPTSRSTPPSGYVPSVGPGFSTPASQGGAPGQPIIGPAQAAGGIGLTVAGHPVQLFGVRPPDTASRCSRPDGQTSCREAAQALLIQRLKSNPGVSCRVPLARAGQTPSAICLDSAGVDLGGLLVGEGLALADTSQSYDYFGAEGIARNYRKGLWAQR